MITETNEAIHVVETVRRAGRIYEDLQNHVWYVPTGHPIFSAVTVVAGPVSRQIEAGLLSTGIDGTRRYAEVSPEGQAWLESRCSAEHTDYVDRCLADLMADAAGPTG